MKYFLTFSYGSPSLSFLMMLGNDNIGPVLSSTSMVILPSQKSSELRIGHINCQSIKPGNNSVKFDEIKKIVSMNFDIFGLSETWLKPYVSSSSLKIPGYTLVRNDRLNMRGGGVGLFISNSLRYNLVLKISDPGRCESLFVQLKNDNTRVLLGVVYLPNGNIYEFEESHSDLLMRYSDVVVVGDFNCNLFDVCKSGLVRSMCLRCNLSVFHNSRPTHFDISHGSTTLLDFWLISDSKKIVSSGQIQCPSISRHALIYVSVSFCVQFSERFHVYRNFNDIDWVGVSSYLAMFDSTIYFNSSCVEFQSSFLNSLLSSLYEFVPVVRKKIVCGVDNWMKSNSVLFAISLRNLAYSEFLTCSTVENWKIFCRYRNKAKNVIRRERKNYFTKIFSGLDSSAMWRVLRGQGVLGDVGIEYDFNVDEINSYFANVSPTMSANAINFEYFNGPFSFRNITEDELWLAINNVKSKSVGVDNIPINFIKLVYPYISHFLLFHINSILTSSIFPSSWKIARVVPIPKASSVRTFDDMRPISILPTLSKVVEHILKDQILSFLRHDIVSSQYAFRRGHNTTSLLLNLTDTVRSNVNMNKLTALISLDLSKAFNCVNYSTLIEKLGSLFGFSKSACKLVYSYLTERKQFVDINSVYSSVISLSSGVPQGSVLGPLLFILYVNDLPEYINDSICTSFQFADDVFLMFSSNRDNPDVLESNINFGLERFAQWSSLNSLSINTSKTKAILFGVCGYNNPALNISICGNSIIFVDRIKCLGINIDDRLLFEGHVDHICFRVFGILRRIYSNNFFLPSFVRLRLAHTLLMPQICYGLEVISGTLAYIMARLKRIVNAIVRFAYSIKRRGHISEHVETFLGCSFNDFISFRNLLFFFRVIKRGHPLQLCAKFTFSRSTRNPQIVIPRIRCSFLERSFVVRVARCWNFLPVDLRLFSHSNNAFRLKLLVHFSLHRR